MSYHYNEQDIILLPGAEGDLDNTDVSEKHILKAFNDPDYWNEEASPKTVARFFNSKTNPRTLHISFHKAHSLKYAHSLYTDAACIVIEAIKVIKHHHSRRCSHPTDKYEE